MAREASSDTIAGTVALDFENIEGILLVVASLSGVRDTSGLLVLDTGAGYLALDHRVADRLGIVDDVFAPGSVDFADRPLGRLRLGRLEIDQLSPVLVLDAEVVRRVTDRSVLGLLGERALRGRSLLVDYGARRVALVPAPPPSDAPAGSQGIGSRGEPRHDSESRLRLEASRSSFGGLLTARARAAPFRLVGDGKILLRATLAGRPRDERADSLTLILDTGATKSVFFEAKLGGHAPGWRRWPALAGLSAPTLVGNAEARIVRVPRIAVAGIEGAIARTAVDAAVIESPLSDALDRVAGESVHGLLGYSFLRRYRVGIDYRRELVWLDPRPEPWDDRPFEYSHVGIQIERHGSAAAIVAVAAHSPAARAGILAGDTLVAVDETRADRADLATLARRLEGRPGSAVRLLVRRGGAERAHRLVRRRLL